MDEHIITSRIDALEQSHDELRNHVATTVETLEQRIAATETMLRDFRQDVNNGLNRLNDTLSGITTSALKSWPPEAVQALQNNRDELKREAGSKGVWVGAAVSLIGVVAVLMAAIVNHWGH